VRSAHRADTTGPSRRFSRRNVLLGAATVSVGGAVAGAAGLSEAFDTAQPAQSAQDGQDIVVHVRDVRAGRIDVFAGERLIEIRDRDLASRLVKAARGR